MNLAVTAVVIASVLWTKLYKARPIFLAYLLADEMGASVLAFVSNTFTYDTVFRVVYSLKLILIPFLVREVLWSAFERYPGLAEFLKRNTVYLASTSAVVALVLAQLDPSRPWHHIEYSARYSYIHVDNTMPHFYLLEQAVYSSMLTYLVGVSVLLIWFPVRLRRSVSVLIGSFAAYFASQWAGFLLTNIAPRNKALLSIVMVSVATVCAVCWMVPSWMAATDSEESKEAHVGAGLRWNSAIFARLTRQLESINASLSRVVQTNSHRDPYY